VLNFSIRSMMCAPLMAAGKALGAIHLDTMQAGRHFTRDDLALFTAIANQTAVALHSTRMHEELRKRQSVEQDLAMARHVQHSFLPADLPRLPGFDFAASYRAALEVGGDFYDFIALPDGRLGIAVGDVMGKGMPAALMMVRVMSDMRYLAIANPEPAFVLERLNAGLARSGSGNAFVTLVFMLLDPTTRRLTLANAGHYPPLLRCAGGEVKEVDDVESGLPLGAEPDMRYEQESVALGEGDCLVAFTDGVTEAESAAEELYGTERLRAALRAAGPTAACVVSHLLEDIRNFVGDTPQSDDLTLVSMKISPSAARPKPEGDVSTDIAPAPSSAAP